MGLIKWTNKKIQRLDFWDITLTKWSVLFMTLFLVALFPVLASLEWYWYLIVGLACAIRPMAKFLR